MTITSIKPAFNVNYGIGYIGFTFTAGDPISDGIAWFERWERPHGDIKVSHVFVVIGDNQIVEAHAGRGVAIAALEKYTGDARTSVYFREPRGYTAALGQRIANSALGKLGKKYALQLILADAADDSLVGHWMNKLFSGWPARALGALLERDDDFICSMLGAYAMNAQPEFKNRGCLKLPLDTIDPQLLFEDSFIFEDGAQQAVSKQP